ncbi:hypothetical protein ABVT39_006327 [Epinephelus coioides]
MKRLSKHLSGWHNLKNNRERQILNQLATGRIAVGGRPCPLPSCLPHVLWLEKHLRSHQDYSQARIEREIKALKRHTAISRLKALRSADPGPPMVSILDLSDEEPEEGPGSCTKSGCVNARKRVRELEREVKDLREANAALRQERGPAAPRGQLPPLGEGAAPSLWRFAYIRTCFVDMIFL